MPDLSHPMRALFRLPWERGEATPTGRAAKAAGIRADHGAEAPFVGIGLDDALLAALAAGAVTHLPRDRAVLIAALSEPERARDRRRARHDALSALAVGMPPGPDRGGHFLDRAVQGGDRDQIWLHAFCRMRRRAGDRNLRPRAASDRNVVVGGGRPRLDRRGRRASGAEGQGRYPIAERSSFAVMAERWVQTGASASRVPPCQQRPGGTTQSLTPGRGRTPWEPTGPFRPRQLNTSGAGH